MFKTFILPMFLLAFLVLAVAVGGALLSVAQLAHHCAATQGHMSYEGTTAWCRY